MAMFPSTPQPQDTPWGVPQSADQLLPGIWLVETAFLNQSLRSKIMGWLFMSKWGMGGHSSPTEYLDAQFTYERDVDGIRKGLRVVASACVQNRIYYAAAQPSVDGAAGPVFAIVFLVRWNPRNEDESFGYKDMTEHMGPCEATCPASILALLGPADHPYALDWRRRCYVSLRRRARPLDDGMRIRFPEPMTFTDGHVGQEFVVERSSRVA